LQKPSHCFSAEKKQNNNLRLYIELSLSTQVIQNSLCQFVIILQ
jgi:hypothetical protein